jgi:hypothetical protein
MTMLLEPLIEKMIEVNNYDFMFGIDLNKLRSGDVSRIYNKLRAYIAVAFIISAGITYLLYDLFTERDVKSQSEKYYLITLYASMLMVMLSVIYRACTSLQLPELLVDKNTQKS